MNIVDAINLLEFTLDTKRKRHIVGGIFLSVSFFFGGLALTIMTVSSNDKSKNESEEYGDGPENND